LTLLDPMQASCFLSTEELVHSQTRNKKVVTRRKSYLNEATEQTN